MNNIFTYTTVDTQSYRHLICGRTNDIKALLDKISAGRSVALFGERRIGKSSILFLIRDIVNGEIEEYQTSLLDKTLQATIPSLRTNNNCCHAFYFNIQGIDPKSFIPSLCDELMSFLPNLFGETRKASIRDSEFVAFFNNLNTQLSIGRKLFILLDEVDILLDTDNYKQIFMYLRSIIQSCPKICFVFAGAELWYKTQKDKTLITNLFYFFLKRAESDSMETFLVDGQLTCYLLLEEEKEKVKRLIAEWTGYKPYYVQAICYEVALIHENGRPLQTDWETLIEKRVFESAVGTVIRAFFETDNFDDVKRKILIILANSTGLNENEVARRLGESEKLVRGKISELMALDKVEKHDSGYRIVGSLLEKWGKQNQELPPVKSLWAQRIKWIVAIILFLIAGWILWYTHPSTEEFSFKFPSGITCVRLPRSLEQDETGIVNVSVQNTTAKAIKSVSVSLTSKDIEFEDKNSNQKNFTSIGPYEKVYWKPCFTFNSTTGKKKISSNVIIVQGNQFYKTKQFSISKRVIPIKKFWFFLSAFLSSIGILITRKWNLLDLINNLFPGLPKTMEK